MSAPAEGRPPVVGLVGFYGHGNFGDDLMALIFGLFLRRIGVSFSVYRFCPPCAARFSFSVVQSAEELLESADVLLWGGGGLLAPWPNLTYRVLYPRVASECSRLIGAALRRGVTLLASSVGGDGSCPGFSIIWESGERLIPTSCGTPRSTFRSSLASVAACGSGWTST
jgi:hypothetical protein